MPFIARAGYLLVKFPLFLATATEVTPEEFCDQGYLLFNEPCNSALLFVAGG